MKTAKILHVMISCPSDVVDEAEAVVQVLSEINRSSADLLGVRFDSFRWDKDAAPGIGQDPQEVINSQVADRFDILIGIFWTRIGSPTPRAKSGSVEEIQSAITRVRNEPDAVRLLIYFKTENPPMDILDPGQLAEVFRFKDTLGREGVLYKNFESVEEMKSSLRVNLVQAAKELIEKQIHDNRTSQRVELPSPREAISEEDELGLLDYQDIYEGKLAAATTAMNGIGEALSASAKSTEKRTKEINDLKASGGLDRSEMRRFLHRIAEDWDSLSEKVVRLSAEFNDANTEAFNALSRSIPLMSATSPEEHEQRINLAETLDGLSKTFQGSANSSEGLRSVLVSTPRMTVEHNRAKKRLLDVIGQSTKHLLSASTLAEDISTALRNI